MRAPAGRRLEDAPREGPAPEAREGEVGIGERSGIPHLTPALSAPRGAEGMIGSADRRRIIGHSGQHLGDVARLDTEALPGELAGDVEEATEVAGEHGIGAGRGDLGRLVGHHLIRDFRVFDAERAAEAAAQLGLRQLAERQPADRGE